MNPRAGEIWHWDGTNWTQQVIQGERPTFGGGLIGSPFRPKMVWDVRRGYAILPPSENPIPGGDLLTWTWSGTNWTSHPVPFLGFGNSPPMAGSGLGMVFDSYRGEVIYWAGDGFDQEYVWRWNGSSWMRDSNSAFVGFHIFAGAAYDERRNSVVMFGGVFAGSSEVQQGYSSRTFERVLADEPVLLRPPIVLQDADSGGLRVQLVAAGAPPLTYEWFRDGAPLAETPPFTGTSTPTLIIARSAMADPGRFRCVVRGPCGAITTEEVTLAPALTLRLAADALFVDGNRTLILQWNESDGVLESAPLATGPWSPMLDARSPLTFLARENQYYYRVRRP